jgi:2Fe-2S ferredoxin
MRIEFLNPDGIETIVDCAPGISLMECARAHGIEGIVADCGGERACATCHVHIETMWLETLPPQSIEERELLEFAKAVDATSRLACQIELTAAHDGLRVRVPAEQY